MEEIERMLMLYPIRKAKIEDMKLQLEEMEFEYSLKAQQYEERVQTSPQCPNNDTLLLQKERIEKLIRYNEITCKRVEKWLDYIREEKAREVIRNICFLKKSKSDTARIIDRSIKQVSNLYKKGLEEIHKTLTLDDSNLIEKLQVNC